MRTRARRAERGTRIAAAKAGDGPGDPGPLMNDAEISSIALRVIRRLSSGRHFLLLTDYDGTLTPIVPTPDQAWLPRSVHDDLEALARSARTHVSVLSGRDLADLRERVAVPEAIYGGCHGLEVEGPGMRFRHPGALVQEDTVRAIGRALTLRANEVAGMYVEEKRFGVAVHYRQVAPDQVKRVEAEVAQVLQEHGQRLTSFHGERVIEIQPRVDWTKGDCARWIRDRVRNASGGQLEILCIGDDWTDEHMFEEMSGQAITVKVAGHARGSRAAHRLPDAASVQCLLAVLAAWTKNGR